MAVSDVVSRILDDVIGRQPAPDDGTVVGCAAAAAALVVVPPLWGIARHVVTIAHEGAHGLAALLTGRRLVGIRVHSDTSGLTVSHGRPSGPGMVLTAASGYVGPSLLGLAAAYLLQHRHALAVLWLAVVLLALLLLQIRNFYGLYAVGLAAVGVLAVSWWGSEAVQSLAAWTGAWFLLLAAPRPVLELHRMRRQRRARTSDADLLARLTPVPAILWVGFFLFATVGSLVAGGTWLLRPHGG